MNDYRHTVDKPRPTKAQVILMAVAPFPALVFFKFWAAPGRDPGTLLVVACAMLACCLLPIQPLDLKNQERRKE